MKKFNILIVMLITLGGLLIIIKLLQNPMSKMLNENQNLIDRVITLCENNDDTDTFAIKVFTIMEDQMQWVSHYGNILKQNPELISKIDDQWLDAMDRLGANLENDSNALRKEKKATAIGIIGSKINQDTLINYFKNKSHVNQEALANYIKNSTEAKK